MDGSIEVILKKKGREVYSITANAMIFDALTLMAEKGVGALVVMDGDTLEGIFSERDYARKVILAGRSSREMHVHEIMSSEVLTVTPKSTVSECMQHMTNKRCRHLPVVHEGKIIAVISMGDLVNWIISNQERTIHDLEDFISGDYHA
jgi:CBS domain-containing protein